MKYYERFPKLLVKHMAARGFTEKEFAQKLGVDVRNVLGMYTWGVYDPTLRTLTKILEALNMTIGEFFEEEE